MGCGILGIGIYLKVEKGDYAELSDLNYITASNVIIAAGVITTIVSFLGCCGAIKEIAPMLLTVSLTNVSILYHTSSLVIYSNLHKYV